MDTVTKVPTYQATIYCGMLGEQEWTAKDAEDICQRFVNERSLCVTVTKTDFIYNGGREPGFIIGLINYPRFPSNPLVIKERALTLAALLKKRYQQKRVTVVCTDETIMLGDIYDS
jgi:hypothetical protein